MNRLFTKVLFSLAIFSLIGVASCKKGNTESSQITPNGSAPVWGPSMHKEMIAVIEQLDSFHAPGLQTLSAPAARLQPTLFDAGQAVAKYYGIGWPFVTADTIGLQIPVAGTSIHARIYKPHTGSGPFPAIVYFHGGGFTLGSTKMYDATARSLAEQTGAIVVSVDYRLAPENKFPTAHNDAFAAYKYVVNNATTLSVNANKLAVCGEGAGANLACNVSITARDSSIKAPVYQLLLYPVTEGVMNTASYATYASAEPFSKSELNWMQNNYLTKLSDTSNIKISLVTANLHGLPPTTIINAEIDPLSDDGLNLESAMRNAGVSVYRKLYSGVTHDFYCLSQLLPEAKDAQGVGVAAIRNAFQ